MRFHRSLLFCAIFLSGIASAASDFKLGPDSQLDSLALAASDTNYALTYRDIHNAGAPEMRAFVATTTGAFSADVPLSSAGAQPLVGSVQLTTFVFDPTTRNFFSIWADDRVGARGIYGAFFTQQGVPVGTDFQIAPLTRAGSNAPQLTFTGAGFLVAWQDEAASGSSVNRIYFTRVSSSGVVQSLNALPYTTGQDQKLEFLVNGIAGELLMVWQDIGATPNTTRATRIGGDNSFVDSGSGLFLFQRDFGVSGFGAPVGAVFDGTEYLILSSLSAQIDSSVFKTRIRADGSVIRASSPFAEVGQGFTKLAEDAFPRTFFTGSEFFFVRNNKVSDTAFHIQTKRVKLDGTDRDPNMPLIDTASQGVLEGAMAANIGDQILVVWMDGRRGGSQPERGLNIFGYFVDDTKLGDETLPFLKCIAHATPIFGNSPLTCTFGNGGSTGLIDSQLWDFGDGGVDDIGNTTHEYDTKGDFIAVLSLIHAGIRYHDYVKISVDTDQLGGAGGPPEVTAGTLGPVGNNVDTNILMYSLGATINFTTPGFDQMRLYGYINPSVLPVNVLDTVVTFSVAGKTYSVTVDVNGNGISDTTIKPISRFLLNRVSGTFTFQTSSDDLVAGFGALGATNATVTKPGADIYVPYTFSFGTLTQSATLNAKYVAKVGKSGRLSYLYGVDGYPGLGYFRIFGGAATEIGKTAPFTHKIVATGNMGLGGANPLTKSDTGVWRISVGNYSEDIPVAQLTDNKGSYTFKAGKGKVGIQQFFYIQRSGQFGIALANIPADGPNPSGMPLATSPFARTDLAVSVQFDLTGGDLFQASGYLRLGRNKAGSKKWKLR